MKPKFRLEVETGMFYHFLIMYKFPNTLANGSEHYSYNYHVFISKQNKLID